MQRCRNCEGTITPKETECLNCGSPVNQKDSKLDIRLRCRTAIKWLFLASAVMSVVSLFTSFGPPLITCVAATVVLGLVKNSADEMLFDHDKK